MSGATRERQGLKGYAALVTLVAGGALGALVLGGMGLAAYFGAADATVKTTRDGHLLLGTLENALMLWSFGVLSLLVAVIALIVLIKGLADDVATARRGPVRAEDER
jgi:hypothetical protein